MPRKATRRGWGKIRKIASGRFQASYIGPDTSRYVAPHTFETRTDAETWLLDERRLMAGPDWLPPKDRYTAARSGQTLAEYAPDAIRRRRTRGRPLKPRTIALYDGLLDRVIVPVLGETPMRTVTADDVNRWYDDLDPEQETQRAHAYALLRSLFDQAVHEGRMPAASVNPCKIKGAGITHRKREIHPATVDELATITDAMPARLQLLVLLCAWCGLRFGEAAALRRGDLDVKNEVLNIQRGVVRVKGEDITDTPKSAAGVRQIALPPHLVPAVKDHLARYVAAGASSLVFPHVPGGSDPWQHGTVYKYWICARQAAGREDLRLHDLRHTQAVMAAQSGASLAELMLRLGHSTPAMALRYQHVAQGRDAQIAAALSKMATARPKEKSKKSKRKASE